MGAGIHTLQNSKHMPVPSLPVGIPFIWDKPDIPYPDGTLLCNGQSFVLTDYPELAKVYPSGVLPDYRGVVPRGLDRGRGVDVDGASRVAGSYQADAFRTHQHTFYSPQFYSGETGGTGSTYGQTATTTPSFLHPTDFNGGSETRMKNIGVDWLVYARTMFYDLTIEGANAYMLGGHLASYYASKQDVINATEVVTSDTALLPNNWYRKYPDGWMEQGGHTIVTNGDLKTFIIPFISKPTVIVTCSEVSAWNSNITAMTGSVNTSSFKIYHGGGTSYWSIAWEAKGRWK